MSVTDALQLNKTTMFVKIRDGLPLKQQTQELLDCKDDLLFAWDAKDSCLLVTNWRAALSRQIPHQTLLPSTPQNFDVERVVVSEEGSMLALAGARGVAILELPRRWGKSGQYMNGKERITCRTCNLDALLFSNNPHLEVRQVRWHPGSTTDSHLLVLLSDNTIRIYNNSQLRHVWQVGPMQSQGTQANANSSFGTFGETTVDFDFAPAVNVKSAHNATLTSDLSNITLNQTQKSSDQTTIGASAAKVNKIEWPLVLLRENGNIYILMIGLDSEKTRLHGPVTITPQTTDNYGLDSCAVLVVPSLPPSLVIAESNGKLHHGLLLDAETAEDSFSEVDARIDIKPSEWVIHVLETVELELGLPKNLTSDSARTSFNCPIYLKRDYINELRYFAYHNTGLHVVSINFVAELQRFLESKADDDKVSLSTLSRAEYLVCTKINASNRVNAVLGFVLLQMPNSLVLLLSSGQVLSLKIVIDAKFLVTPATTPRPSVVGDNQLEQLLTGPTFVEHIRGILQRNLTQPILLADKSNPPNPHECYELLNQAMEVLRAQYLKRHETVRAEFAKRINRIRLQKEQQLREIENLEHERETISERAHKLAERFEEINDYQELLVKRCYDLMRQVNVALPGNVAAEREFSQDISKLNKSTKILTAAVENIKKSINKQKYHIGKGNEALKTKNFELPEKQNRTITDVLTQMATEIDRQIKDIKRINELVGI